MNDDFQRLSWILAEVSNRNFYETTPEILALVKHLNNLSPVVYAVWKTDNAGGDQSENSKLITDTIGSDKVLKSTLGDAGSIIDDLKRLMKDIK